MKDPAPDVQTGAECRTSAYAAQEDHPLGRLIWCAVRKGQVSRVFDIFIGSGCSAATSAAAMSLPEDERRLSSQPRVVTYWGLVRNMGIFYTAGIEGLHSPVAY